jgi:hypothetical protein
MIPKNPNPRNLTDFLNKTQGDSLTFLFPRCKKFATLKKINYRPRREESHSLD